jgi:serine/threonine protein kinase/tetratricopeptide (TPR) repeat protein
VSGDPRATVDVGEDPRERNRRIRALFEGALELGGADRASFFAARCGDDHALREELEQLLGVVDDLRTSDVLPPLVGDHARTDEPGAVDHTVNLGRGPTWRSQLNRGQTIGRFVVLGLVGRGGMGEVYAAYDPELDRRIAVKLLRARSFRSDDGRARILREAQAIARLSHPNVVVVYDVGTLEDRVFIAMEYVEGRTLRLWLEERKRTWRETLDVFAAAGRGLAAAHDAGMIHRDFKPDNVMITTSGATRVMDFGLARQVLAQDEEPLTTTAVARRIEASRTSATEISRTAAVASAPSIDEKATPLSSGGYLRAKITETGAQIGTPAYMAPEQFLRESRSDARTDQFSFCVALYEALYGERPFAGEETPEIRTAVLAGAIRPAPAHSGVPGWIRRVVLRGLATDPTERYPSMSALLAALERDPVRRLKRRALAATAAAAIALVVAMAHQLGARDRPRCTGGATRLAGVWEPGTESGRKTAVREAFTRSGKSYAAQAFAGVSRLLDQYVERWTGMYVDACEATNVRGEQSAEVLDLRMSCLNERLGNLRALSDVFAAADGKVVENAVSAASTLPSLDRCADVALLRAADPPPDDPVVRQRVPALRDELARLVALKNSGQCQAASKNAEGLLAAVRPLGYPALLAETLNAAAVLGDSCADPVVSLARAKEGHSAATASHRDELAAETSTFVAYFSSNRLGQLALAREWLEIARGDVARLGHETMATSMFMAAEGFIATEAGESERARALADRALGLSRKLAGPDSTYTLAGELNLGDWQERAGRLEEALRTDLETRAHAERVLGRDHPLVANICNNEGEVLNLLDRPLEAEAAYQRAIDIWRASGTDPNIIAWGLTGLGRARLEQNRPAAARAALEEALASRIAGTASPGQLAETRFELARAIWPAPAERRRALELASTARTDAAADKNEKMTAEIDGWLARARSGRL